MIGFLVVATLASGQDDLDVTADRSLTATITISQVIDDNVFETERDPESDLITYIRPQYDLFYPLRVAAFRISAGLPIYYHWYKDDYSDVLYDVAATISTARGRGFAFTIRDELTPILISYGGTEIEETNKNRVQSNTLTATPSFRFGITSRSDVTLRYSFLLRNLMEDGYEENNYYEHTSSILSKTALTARITLSIIYQYSFRELLELDIQRQNHQFTVSLNYVWNRLTLGILGGVSYYVYQGDDTLNEEDSVLGEYVGGHIGWVVTEWLTLKLSFRRALTGDLFSNAFFVQDVSLGFTLPVTSWLTFSIAGYVRDYRNETVTERSDLVFGGNAGLAFLLVEGLTISSSYGYVQNIGDRETNDFSNNVANISLNYTF